MSLKDQVFFWGRGSSCAESFLVGIVGDVETTCDSLLESLRDMKQIAGVPGAEYFEFSKFADNLASLMYDYIYFA